MTKEISNNKRIAKNTLMLYVRQMVVIAVGLYTVRIVLEVLGVEDYGVYNVVGGVVAMLSFLSGTMASATQRFFSFYLGRGDTEKLKQVFSVNIMIYLILIGIVFILFETVGLWFVNSQLEIPDGREAAVRFIFQFSILAFVANMLSSPFIAAINAHEDMQLFAYVSIVDATLKLGVVFVLQYFDYDKLELYSVLLFIAAVISKIIYVSICLIKYEECQFRRIYWSKDVFKEVMSFSSWTLFGSIAFTMRIQGVTILINQFFTPITVASRAIATQVTSQLHTFTNNFNASLYPPIIKSYSNGNLEEMYQLIFRGTKIAFFLVWLFALPLCLYMEEILTLWLKTVPSRAVLFTRFALIEIILHAISHSIMTAARATGKMKVYELTFGIINTLLAFFVWLAFFFGAPDYAAYVIIITINILMFSVRLLFVRNLTGLSLRQYVNKVVLRMAGVVLITVIATIPLYISFSSAFTSVLFVGTFSLIISCVAMYYIGLEKVERNAATKMILNKIKR